MIVDALRYVKRMIVSFFSYIISIPSGFSNFVNTIQFFIYDQKRKLNNLAETNIELGKHHLFQGHIKDATLRFKITQWLFDKSNKEIDYWLGWCYFMKSDYDTATPYITEGKEFDKEKLGNFITNYKTLDEVPYKIWDVIQRISIAQDNDRYYFQDIYNKQVDLPLEFISFMLDALVELKENAQILDYGAGSGLVGSMLDYKTDLAYSITAVEGVEMYVNYIKDIRGDRGAIYDSVFYSHLDDLHNIFHNTKYDIILSFDSLGFVKNLAKYFAEFYAHLSSSGYFVLLLPSKSSTQWSAANRSFVYNEEDLAQQLKLANFNIIAIKKWKLKAGLEFISFVCSK